MDYASAVRAAPGGWRHFDLADLDRLRPGVRRKALDGIPPAELQQARSGDGAARERVRRALFWTFVYHLEPDRWDALAEVERIHPDLLALLPLAERAVDVGAGSGRLSGHLVSRCGRVVAVEPAHGLASLLRGRVPEAITVEGWAESLPIAFGWADLTAACGSFGPERAVIAEMERVTRHGGTIALISPEQPEVFESLGWTRITTPRLPVPLHPDWIDDFFGPPDPPHEIVYRKRGHTPG